MIGLVGLGFALSAQADGPSLISRGVPRPNVFIAISDDQSFAHTSASGFKAVRTPAFDRVAGEGVLFRNGFCASPGCSPSRAALLTGRHTWQIEQAGTHMSSFPTNYVVFPDLLEEAGYWIGCTGKGWSPGKRPAEELFNIVKDPGCLTNLAVEPALAQVKSALAAQMLDYLKEAGEPRVTANGDIWETYPRYSNIRKFPPSDARETE